MRPFDIVLASGLLHHLDDEAVGELMQLVRLALRAGGRFAAIDPVMVSGQNRIARALIERDRGLNVGTRRLTRRSSVHTSTSCAVWSATAGGFPTRTG